MGHALTPVVQIGKGGLTKGVTDELKNALQAHELIKVRLLGESPLDRADAGKRIAAATRAELIQAVGGILLFYLPNLDKPKISLTPTAAIEKATGGKAKASAKRRRLPPSRTGAKERSARSDAYAQQRRSRAGDDAPAPERRTHAGSAAAVPQRRSRSGSDAGAPQRNSRFSADAAAPGRRSRSTEETSGPERRSRFSAGKK